MKERLLLILLAATGLALLAWSQAEPPAGLPEAFKELEDFKASEQIEVDISVPFPQDI